MESNQNLPDQQQQNEEEKKGDDNKKKEEEKRNLRQRAAKARYATERRLNGAESELLQAWKSCLQSKSKSVDIPVFEEKEMFCRTPNELKEYAEKFDRFIKTKEMDCIYNSSLKIIDLSLTIRGEIEDDAFAAFPDFHLNLRRGNTLIVEKDENNQNKCINFGRKGLNKFFDCSFGFISEESRYNANLPRVELILKNYIFADAWRSLNQGKQVEVIKTLKANGENAQVSWNSMYQTWVIASKNVALLARTRADLNYPDNKFQFASLIAQVWFDKIEKLGQKELEELKRDIKDSTLVAEYIGNQDHQHLIKYEKKSLLFYAIVDHNINQLCWPCELALHIFQTYGLDSVDFKSEGLCKTFDELCDCLVKVYKKISENPISEDEEGSVIYLAQRNQDAQEDKILSLCKIKTLEYRALRKMREKLKYYFSQQKDKPNNKNMKQKGDKKQTPDEVIHKYQKELQNLMTDSKSNLPKGLEYYVKLLKAVFEYIAIYQDQEKEVREKFISFLEVVIQYCKDNDIDLGSDSGKFSSQILQSQEKIKYSRPDLNNSQKRKPHKVVEDEEEEKGMGIMSQKFEDKEEEQMKIDQIQSELEDMKVSYNQKLENEEEGSQRDDNLKE